MPRLSSGTSQGGGRRHVRRITGACRGVRAPIRITPHPYGSCQGQTTGGERSTKGKTAGVGSRTHGSEVFDPGWFRANVFPGLTTVSLPAIAKATGMSTTAAGKVRSGYRVPHPRHWEALAGIGTRVGRAWGMRRQQSAIGGQDNASDPALWNTPLTGREAGPKSRPYSQPLVLCTCMTGVYLLRARCLRPPCRGRTRPVRLTH